MAQPVKVTLEISDNPMAGRQGQTDFNIVVSCDPDLDLSNVPEGQMPDPEGLPLPIVVAIEMIQHITGMAHEAVFIQMVRGESQ